MKAMKTVLYFLQIRLDRLVDKWSGSIEVGITTHNPNELDFPATMTNMRSRTGNSKLSAPVYSVACPCLMCGIVCTGKK
jgi:hypothetical protein